MYFKKQKTTIFLGLEKDNKLKYASEADESRSFEKFNDELYEHYEINKLKYEMDKAKDDHHKHPNNRKRKKNSIKQASLQYYKKSLIII